MGAPEEALDAALAFEALQAEVVSGESLDELPCAHVFGRCGVVSITSAIVALDSLLLVGFLAKGVGQYAASHAESCEWCDDRATDVAEAVKKAAYITQ